jgi:ribokinase
MDQGVLVVGQLGRDVVVRAASLPAAGGSEPVTERIEMLGGKGANQAVGLRQLGVAPVRVLGVVGEDPVGSWVLDQARESGLDVTCVRRRGATALLLDVVTPEGRRLLEDVPLAALLTEDDVRGAASAFVDTDTVCLQLQQPAGAVLAAAELAVQHGARVVMDGGAPPDARDRLVELADVIRADRTESASWTGRTVADGPSAEAVATELLERGVGFVALEVPDEGDYVAWPGGGELLPHGDAPVVDPTGAGDAFAAGVVAALRWGADPQEVGRFASRAAAATVARLGGRPDLRSLNADP